MKKTLTTAKMNALKTFLRNNKNVHVTVVEAAFPTTDVRHAIYLLIMTGGTLSVRLDCSVFDLC